MGDAGGMTTTNEPLVLAGGCQCGAVRYTVKAASNEAYFCHCRMCQRAFGNIFATLFNVARADVTWETREPDYFASSKIARRGFCKECGTPLTFAYNDSKRMDLAVGSLDDPGVMKPVMHVGADARVASFAHTEGLPEKRVEEFEHIVAKWKSAYGPDATPGTWATAAPDRPQG